ncbi:MAG: hypothetical protein O2919_10180 [Chloroflexi bacterium]|nr:hypothetical protein [Chloroflexota bacterium]
MPRATRRPSQRWLAPFILLAAAAAMLLGACGDIDDGDATPDGGTPAATTATAVPTATSGDATPTATAGGSGVLYDPTLVPDGVACSLDILAEAHETYRDAFLTAHHVIGDTLGALCFGDEDARLIRAWELLRLITPPEEFAYLVLIAGFDRGDEPTGPLGELVAWVNDVGDADGTQFQMSINLVAAEEDEGALILTLAHEFAHVFTQRPDQLDRSMDPFACPTLYNGTGCFERGSYIDEWITRFWHPDDIAAYDPWEEDVEGAEDRCSVDGGFLGVYAATAPEEDFAEAFSAFVLDVPVDTEGLVERMLFFEGYPDLVAFRTLARAAGLTPQENIFEPCG